MTGLKELDEFGMALDPAVPGPPADLRRRVLTQVSREPDRATAGLPRFAMPRMRWRLAAVGGMAAVLTAGVLVSQVVTVGDRPPAAKAYSAGQILQDAAVRVGRQPVLPVHGNQFIYVQSIIRAVSLPAAGDKKPSQPDLTLVPTERRVWLSADGTGDGLIQQRPQSGGQGWQDIPLPGCRDGMMTATKGTQTARVSCHPTPWYHDDLPTSTSGMHAYLYKSAAGTKNPVDQEAFTDASDLIREAYLPPASLAAVFNVLAKIPGVTIVGDVTDNAGRTGVAVALTEVQGMREELIFDRTSHAFLGERSVEVRDEDGLKAGQVLSSAAQLKVAVVNQVGQTS